jgi:hypothetical protein
VAGPRTARVTHVDGTVWEVRMRTDTLAARPPNCGSAPEPATSLVVDTVERVEQDLSSARPTSA